MEKLEITFGRKKNFFTHSFLPSGTGYCSGGDCTQSMINVLSEILKKLQLGLVRLVAL